MRDEAAYACGVKFMLFRIYAIVAGTAAWAWQRCSGREPGHVADSRVHRYEREIQFERGDSAEELNDARISAARERMRAGDIGTTRCRVGASIGGAGRVVGLNGRTADYVVCGARRACARAVKVSQREIHSLSQHLV